MSSTQHSTRDLNESAFLLASGFPVVGLDTQIEGSKGKVGYWSFDATPELREALSKYNSFQSRVEPHAIMNAARALKGQVVNREKNPNF